MNYQFASKMDHIKPSAIREVMLKASNGGKEEYINFASGFPDPSAIPQQQLLDIGIEVFSKNTYDLLQYGINQSYTGLVASAKQFINRQEQICFDDDDILITSGSQQGLDLVSKIFINEGDTIVVENPSFLGAFDCFRCNGAKLKGVPLLEDGVDLIELEKAFSTKPAPKLFYIIPNFQNPTGITTSFAKRKAIYELAKKYGVIILEDNPYGYLRISGDDLPPIKALDNEGIVIYAASMSKIVSPGLRTGILCAKKELIQKVQVAKQFSDTHTNSLAQYIIDGFLRTTDMDKHIATIKGLYAKKCHLMMEMMDKYFHPDVTYQKVDGGMFIWFTLPDKIDMHEFIDAAAKKHIALVPGNEFLVDTSERCQSIRMNFSASSIEQIETGIQILGALTYEMNK